MSTASGAVAGADLLAAYRALHPDAKRSGREYKGPCPVCGGDDRFWISETKLGCRGCRPGRNNPGAFLAILTALGQGGQRQGDLPRDVVRRANAKRARILREREKRGHMLEEARQAWEAAAPPGGTPARTYLVGERLCWPPARALPPAVRWLARSSLISLLRAKAQRERPEVARRYPRSTHGLVRPVTGAVAYAFTDASGTLASVDLEALMADGKRPQRRWRRTLGLKGHGLFRVDGPGNELQIVEGAVSALAARWLCDAPAVATGGTVVRALATLHASRARIHVDGDRRGREGALAALDKIPATTEVRIERYAKGTDAADKLRGLLQAGEAWAEGYQEGVSANDPQPPYTPERHSALRSAAAAAWHHHLSQLQT